MKKLKNKIGLTALCASLLVLAPSFAKADYGSSCNSCNTCNPCDPCDCWGEFEFGADFLFWKPCVDDLDYAAEEVTSTDTPSTGRKVKYRCIDPDWEPGVRVFFALPDFYCDWGLSASWTWIETHDDGTLTADNKVLAVRLHPHTHSDAGRVTLFDKAKGHWDATYNEWEILFSTDLSCKECHHFMPFFGIAGIILDQEFDVHYYDKINDVYTKTFEAEWDSNIWGIGLRAGFEYQYRFNECFSFFGKTAGTILYSDRANGKHKSEHLNTATVTTNSAHNITVKDDDCCHFIPGWHIGAGFSYDTCWCDWDFHFRFGYEFLQWCNIPNHRNFNTDDVDGRDGFGGFAHNTHGHSSSNTTRTFGFQGFFAGLGVSF